MTNYELSRNWFDWCFENPELISPHHTAIYFFALEHQNRLGGKDKFGFPSQMTMEALGIRKHQTYISYFNDLIDWGFIDLIQKSSNQYSANIISINKNAITKNGKALDKAFIKHRAKQTQSTGQSNSSIDKQVNKETIEQVTILLKKETKQKEYKFNYNDFLFFQGAEKQLILEWAEVRKLKKLSNTLTAMEDFVLEVQKSGQNINEILKICIIKSWGGFKYKFLQNEQNADNNKNANSPQWQNGGVDGIQGKARKQSFVVTPESLYAAMQAREEN